MSEQKPPELPRGADDSGESANAEREAGTSPDDAVRPRAGEESAGAGGGAGAENEAPVDGGREPGSELPSGPTGEANAGSETKPPSAAPEEDAPAPATSAAAQKSMPPLTEEVVPAPARAAAQAPAPPVGAPRRGAAGWLAERPEVPVEIPQPRLTSQSRRDFLIYSTGVVASAVVGWWLLPGRTKARLLPGAHDALDTLASRVGLSSERAEGVLDRALTFDDDIAEALYSKDRSVRTYSRADARPLRNNYNGQTPGPEYLERWSLQLSGLASGRVEHLSIEQIMAGLPMHEQVTRLVCVEGWSGVAWWGGVRFADMLNAFPPAAGARWAAIRSAVNLDGRGRPDPYYVSIDLDTARHPQTLLATQYHGKPLTLAHGAPLRLLAPMKLGLKNIKAITEIAYTASEPPDYWNERGYSKYDGL